MEIEDLTLGQIRELQSLLPGEPLTPTDKHWKLGKSYFIRTVTHYLTGLLVSVSALELVLTDAAWIADTGRYSEAIATGSLNEVEPYPDGALVIVGRGTLIDATLWTHALPRNQK